MRHLLAPSSNVASRRGIDRDRDLPLFAWLEIDPIPPDQAQQNVRAFRSSEIELRSRRTPALARIPHCRSRRHRLAADVHGELAQCECAVGEPEAERKQWLLAPLEKPFIADRCAFIVHSGEHRAVLSASPDRPNRRAVRIALDLRMRQLIFADSGRSPAGVLKGWRRRRGFRQSPRRPSARDTRPREQRPSSRARA